MFSEAVCYTAVMIESTNPGVRRLIYRSLSTAAPESRERDRLRIFAQCRLNNGLEAVSGILLVKAARYLQVLEGSPQSVGHIFDLIEADLRHTEIEVLEDSIVPGRMFGGWGMAALEDGDADELRRRISYFLPTTSSAVRQAFEEAM
jgi:hypothetical protein